MKSIISLCINLERNIELINESLRTEICMKSDIWLSPPIELIELRKLHAAENFAESSYTVWFTFSNSTVR